MRYSGFFISVMAVIMLVAVPVLGFAQATEQETKAFISRTTDSLREAGKPLSEEQLKKMESLEPGRNFRNEVMNILTDDQKDALRKSFRNNSRDRRGSGDRGDFRERMVQTLKDAGHPMTEEQITKLKALEFGPGMREQMDEIFTEEQSKALQEARQRGGDRGERRSPSEFIGRTLQEAGDPLTEEQKKKIDALEFGRGMRDQINEVLTDSQKKILEEQRQQRGDNR